MRGQDRREVCESNRTKGLGVQNQARCGFKGLRTLAAEAGFAGRAGATFAERPVTQTFAAVAVIRLSGTAVAGLSNVARVGHLLLARSLTR